MYERILLPIDGSETMDAVVDCALDVALPGQTTVHLLYVADTRAFLTLSNPDRVADELQRQGEAVLERVEHRLDAAGIDVRGTLAQGDPADEIVSFVEETPVDVVVMGAHANYEQNMLGSVSRAVLARSPVPVLTVSLSAGATESPAPAVDD